MSKYSVPRSGVRRLTALLAALVLLLGAMGSGLPAGAATQEGDTASRLIHVVYDDSNSMIMNKSTAWSEAKYSLEILSAMMQKKDTMNVYFMSDFYPNSTSAGPALKNLSGADPVGNIGKIHNKVTDTSGTPFSSIRKAYQDLTDASGRGQYDEYHMVVITDGDSFYNSENGRDLDSLFGSAKQKNIKVTYLAIGQNAIKPSENPDGNVYVYQATPDNPNGKDSILKKVTEMGERIFQRPAHPVNSGTLKLKIPVSEIVIFAQGKDVAIGDIPGTNKNLSTAGITAADRDKASLRPDNSNIGGIQNVVVAEGLSGAVATFTPASGEYISEGEYTLDVNVSNYTVYYKPCLDVVLKLSDADGTEVKDGDEVNIGVYTAKYFLTYPEGHPNHGQEANVSGLDIDPAYTLTVTTDGKSTHKKGDSPTDVELKEGKTRVTVTAQYLTYISTDSSLNLAVEDLKVYPLTTELTPDKREYVLSEMEGDKEGYTLTVRMEDGSPVPAELWKVCQATVNCEGLDFEVKKNDGGTFTLFPRRKNGKYEDTASGDVPFTAVATVTEGGRVTYKGNDAGVAVVYNDVIPDEKNGGFAVEVEKVLPSDIKSTEFNKAAPTAQVKITWNGNPLTEAQYKALKLTAAMKKEHTTKSGKPLIAITAVELAPYVKGEATTATLRFTAEGTEEEQRKKLSQHDTFMVNAVLEREGVKNEAKGEGDLAVERVLSKAEILGIILLILAILFFICGWLIFKKWLPFRIRIKYGSGAGIKKFRYPYFHPLALVTVLLPFVPVTSVVSVRYTESNGGTGDAKLTLRAAGGKSAIVVNAWELYEGEHLFVNGESPLRMYARQRERAERGGRAANVPPPRKPEVRMNCDGARLFKRGRTGAVMQFINLRAR